MAEPSRFQNTSAIVAGDFASPVLVPGERRLKLGVGWRGDHSAVEGAEPVAFMESQRRYVEAPQRLIGEDI